MTNKAYPVAALFFGAAFLLSIAATPLADTGSDGVGDGVERTGLVTVDIIKDGEVVDTVKEKNLVTDLGLNWTRSQVSAVDDQDADTNEAEYISLGNGTAPTASTTAVDQEIGGGGLARAQGSTYSRDQVGNFSVYNTYTSTVTTTVNTTCLNYNASGPSCVAGTDFARDVNLQPDDQINVTWTVWYSNAP